MRRRARSDDGRIGQNDFEGNDVVADEADLGREEGDAA